MCVCVCVWTEGYLVFKGQRARDKEMSVFVCVFTENHRRFPVCSTATDPQRSLFHLLVLSIDLQHWMAALFNYSEAIDLLNELTYSSGPVLHNFRSGSRAVLLLVPM